MGPVPVQPTMDDFVDFGRVKIICFWILCIFCVKFYLTILYIDKLNSFVIRELTWLYKITFFCLNVSFLGVFGDM